LNGNPIASPLVLSPFTSQVLIPAVFCQASLNPTARNFTMNGGSGTINVMTGSNCAWSASSDAAWITIVSGAAGTGGGTVSFQVAANSGGARSGTLTIAGQFVSVTQDGPAQVLSLNAGWNWVSFNRLPGDRSFNAFFASILSQLEQVKTQTQSAVYANGQWLGDLTDMNGISSGIMYKIKVKQACTLTLTGQSLSANQAIALGANWNWVAYLPSVPMSLTSALGSIAAQVQQIKSESQSATFGNGVWSGPLTLLEPGKGYAVKLSSAETLIYPLQ